MPADNSPEGAIDNSPERSPGSCEEIFKGAAWVMGIAEVHDAGEGTKSCNRLRRNDNKVSLVTDNGAPNLRYKDCSGWHVDCTINVG